MVAVDARGLVILKDRVPGKVTAQVAGAGLAVVEEPGLPENRLAFDVEGQIGEPLGEIEDVVKGFTGREGDRVIFIPLGQGEDIVRVGILPKFVGLKILEKARVTEFVDVNRRVDVLGEIGAILQRDAVSVGIDLLARGVGLIGLRGAVVKRVGGKAAPVFARPRRRPTSNRCRNRRPFST